MRTYVSTLGFHEPRVTRPVLRHGLDDEDEVVLLRPAEESDDERGTRALDHVRNVLGEVAPGASIAVERVDPEFESAVRQCCGVLADADGDLVVNFGGGAREVFLPFTVATLLYTPRIDVAFQYTDIDQQVREVPFPNLTAQVPETVWPTFELLTEAGGSATIPELTERSEHSKSTVTRHVDLLEEQLLVRTKKEGKTRHVERTISGQLLFPALDARRD